MKNQIDRRTFIKTSAALLAMSAIKSHGFQSLNFSSQHFNKHSPKKIIIIGAGVSGLAAAQELKKTGHEVTILEARDRNGGRIFTHHNFSAPVEFGATWLHGGPKNPLKEIYSNLGIEKKIYDATRFAVARTDALTLQNEPTLRFPLKDAPWIDQDLSRAMTRATIFKLLTDLHPTVAEVLKRAKKRIDQHLPQISAEEKDEVFFLLEHFLETELAEDLDHANIHELMTTSRTDAQGEIIPLGEEMVLGGMDRFINFLSRDLTILHRQVVTRISYGAENGVEIKTRDQTYSADAVIVTVPLGVLQSGAIDFDPVLPRRHQHAIDRLGMGLLNKVVLEFQDASWFPDAEFLSTYPNKNPSCAFHVNLHAYTQKPILIGIAGGSRAKAFESKSDETVVRETIEELRCGFGHHIPTPVKAEITRWGLDPFSQGSYSGQPVGSTRADRRHLQNGLHQKLFFAGEATDLNDYGSVHGAYWSGLRVANEIASLN